MRWGSAHSPPGLEGTGSWNLMTLRLAGGQAEGPQEGVCVHGQSQEPAEGHSLGPEVASMPYSVPHLLTFLACAHAVPSGWASGVPNTFPFFRCQLGHLPPKPCLMPKIGTGSFSGCPQCPAPSLSRHWSHQGWGCCLAVMSLSTDGCAQLTAVCPAPVWYPAPGVVSSVSQQSWALIQACPVLQCPPGSREPGATCQCPPSPAGTLAPSPLAIYCLPHTCPRPTFPSFRNKTALTTSSKPSLTTRHPGAAELGICFLGSLTSLQE